MEDFEKLGAFYLGRPYDLEKKKPKKGLLLYDSKDLVTHAVCVGMTGSGKTGLCIALLEEAAIDRIPSIIIDPKGDLSNLLQTFPELKPEDFAPWVNEEDAQKKDLSTLEYAAQQAEFWTKTEILNKVSLKPTKANIAIKLLTLAWAPYWHDDQGQTTRAWE